MTAADHDHPEILWRPEPGAPSRLRGFQAWLAEHGGPSTDDYAELWQWSVEEQDAFWLALWRWFDIPCDTEPADTGPTVALADPSMPGAVWFPEVRLNYAETMLRMPGRTDDDTVVIGRSQSRDEVRLTATEFRDLVGRVRMGLLAAGVDQGDRVAAYCPNIPETLAVMLGAASLGAIFSSCAPEFGTQSVTDRLSQIEPKVLVAVDGYRYGDRPIGRRSEVEAIRTALPSVEALIWLPYLDAEAPPPEGAVEWDDFVAQPGPLEFTRVPFDHPLYVLFSSGTTGLPKPILHGHGGITVEHLKALALHNDLGPDDCFFWFSTTGWMMWNYLVSGLGVGATVVMFDGNPAPNKDTGPDTGMLWRLAGELGVTYFGTSAPFLLQCRKEGIVPREIADLSALRGIGSTGAPLPAEGFRWVYEAVSDTALLGSLSGGTDVCSGFVGPSPTLPVYAGLITCRCLGAAVAAYDEDAHPVIGRLGELVIERPMPSMPVGFWGDDDGARYRAAYFEDIPGVWRHGDWITINEDGTCVITGRSDATLNRGGVRLGTAEFYTVVEALPEVLDSLVVHLEDDEGGAGTLVLFVQLTPGLTLDDDVRRAIATALRTQLSPRHVPDVVHQVSALPHTLSGKRIEVPVKKILQGVATDEAVARGALTAPHALAEFEEFRATLECDPDHGATHPDVARLISMSDFPDVQLHIVTGKGGTGKSTVAASLALAHASRGKTVLLCEVEGRQGIAQMFDVSPLPYEERRIARATEHGHGDVYALAIDAEEALLEYLAMYYRLGRAGKALDRFGVIDFATTIAPGVRDVLLTGKVYEAAQRNARNKNARRYDAIVLDAPPTGRIAQFLNVNSELAGLARMGPIKSQADTVMTLLRSPRTAVHLVTVLEEMPVQETVDGVAELRAAGLPVGGVVVNLVRPQDLDEQARADLLDGAVDQASLAKALTAAGIDASADLVTSLVAEGRDHAERRQLEDSQRELVAAIGVPTYELAKLAGGVDLGGLYELAESLCEQGLA